MQTESLDDRLARINLSRLNGYDYHNQAWVREGRYVACGHGKPCDCFGTLHAGESVKANADIH